MRGKLRNQTGDESNQEVRKGGICCHPRFERTQEGRDVTRNAGSWTCLQRLEPCPGRILPRQGSATSETAGVAAHSENDCYVESKERYPCFLLPPFQSFPATSHWPNLVRTSWQIVWKMEFVGDGMEKCLKTNRKLPAHLVMNFPKFVEIH